MAEGLAPSVDRILSRLQTRTSSGQEEPSNSHPQCDDNHGFDTEEQREAAWLEVIGLPKRYRQATLADVSEAARPLVAAYCEDIEARVGAGQGLLVSGPVGVGKSCILGVIARAAYQAFAGEHWSHPVAYVNCARLYVLLMDVDRDRRQLPYSEVRLLLLDELGTAYDNPFAVSQLDALIETRYASGLATCTATNLSVKAMHEDVRWRRVYDRLRDGGLGIALTGASRRS